MNAEPTQVMLENRTYDELQVGDSASLTRTLTKDDIDAFAILSGDVNPAHLDDAYAKETPFQKVIAHGMWGGTLISTVLGTQLPGPGTIYVGQNLRFMRPVSLGDTITVTLTVKEKKAKNMVTLECSCTNQVGKQVIIGEAEIMAPTAKVRRPQAPLPRMHLHRMEGYEQLMRLIKDKPAVRCAVVYPEDAPTLKAALHAAQQGLIMPVLIGSRERISALAQQLELDLLECLWREAESPAQAADIAVEMTRDGEVAAIMQGSIATHTLMKRVLRHAGGLRTSRRISHAYVADVPSYPQPVIITDAEVNVRPSLDDRRDIVQNAIDLAHKLKLREPRVAVLSAAENFNSNLESSTTAAVLCKMHERGRITGALLDGPMTFDAAVQPAVAQAKFPNSPVAGQANILMVPNLEAANMLVKQLAHFAHADIAGIVLGATVPVILHNPIDTPRTRLASAALARIVIGA